MAAAESNIASEMISRQKVRSLLQLPAKGKLDDHASTIVPDAVGAYWAAGRSVAALSRPSRSSDGADWNAPERGAPHQTDLLDRNGYTTGASLGVVDSYHGVFCRPCVQKTVSLYGLTDSVYRNEPQLARDLRHPHIAEIWEAQHDPSLPDAVTFTMPRYEGGSTKDALEAGDRFSVIQALTLSLHLLDALSYVHNELGFIHRDVKPGNALMDAGRANAFLSDFGSAARMNATHEVALAGFTLGYLDPASVTTGVMVAASDVYGIGLMLFELLSGPFPFGSLNPARAQAKLSSGRRPMPDSWLTHAPHVPDRLRRVVNKAIREDRAGRFGTAADMATALGKLRLIDWKHHSGSGLVGDWQGSWPPGKPPNQQRLYRVLSRPLGAGRTKGRLRLEAAYRTPATNWRGFGVSDDTVGAHDARAVAQFFSQVEQSVAHNKAAR